MSGTKGVINVKRNDRKGKVIISPFFFLGNALGSACYLQCFFHTRIEVFLMTNKQWTITIISGIMFVLGINVWAASRDAKLKEIFNDLSVDYSSQQSQIY
jgi:hypothetical protein